MRFIRRTFKLPFLKSYLSIKIESGSFVLPDDWSSRALMMLTGRMRPDADFLARAWFKEKMLRDEQRIKYEQKIRLLERRIYAQRMEIKRKPAPPATPEGVK